MFLKYILFLLFIFEKTHNQETSCGCSETNRKNIGSKYIFDAFKNNLQQCSIENEEVTENFQVHSNKDMILVPAGNYQVGTNDVVMETDKEGPQRILKLDSFYLDKYEVSNRDFSRFSAVTNYKTEAESFGDSFVFTLFLNSTLKQQLHDYRVAHAPWWYKVDGANWRHPYGPDSDIRDLMDHAVVHVSWNDAAAYCKWRNARLPTEAEWEAACRGGHRNTIYPWGDKLFPGRKHMANIWQGTFPNHNSAKDGYIGTNPVHLFPQNDFGFHNMAGNVWEWTQDTWSKTEFVMLVVRNMAFYLKRSGYSGQLNQKNADYHTEMNAEGFTEWFTKLLLSLEEPLVLILDNVSYHSQQLNRTPTSANRKAEIQEWLREHGVAFTEDDFKPELLQKHQEKVKKGGSYLCHRSYCYRYRCSARSHNTADSSAGNLGFRCAKSV